MLWSCAVDVSSCLKVVLVSVGPILDIRGLVMMWVLLMR